MNEFRYIAQAKQGNSKHDYMISEQIQKLLQGRQQDPDTGQKINVPIKVIVVDRDLHKDVASLLEPLELGDNPLVVCDINTNAVMGEKIANALGCERLMLQGKIYPSEERIKEIRIRAEHNSGIIAVGSGTINDLCKYASYIDNKPYVVFATALSMNGYTSANASIENIHGYKKSYPAWLPKGIFLDTKVLEGAPARLTASGLADVLCRSTAQADWQLSNLLLGTEYNPLPFEWLQDLEEELMKNSLWLAKGDHNATLKLIDAILLSGLGMYVCRGSYPASQGEHIIAHTMEMVHSNVVQPSYHGEQIAVTTLTMAKLQEFMLLEMPVIKPKQINEKAVLHYFGVGLGHHCLSEMQKKNISQEKADKINAHLKEHWGSVKMRIKSKMVPYRTLKNALEMAEAPTKPEDLGWDKELYRSTVKHALLTRNRFTFLDLAYYSGKLDEFLSGL